MRMSEALDTHKYTARIGKTITSLMEYCRMNEWAGFDPYDGLNSRVFNLTPFVKSRVCRIAITQFMKRFPVDLRPLLLVPKEQNPKAIALFLMAYLKLSRLGWGTCEEQIPVMVDKLIALRSPNSSHWCWGYSFPWQTRTYLVPKWSPNLVSTAFVANALLDVYEQKPEAHYLDMALGAGDYVLNELYWEENPSLAGFSYPLPGLRTRVHNVNFLGAALLCRLYKHCGRKEYLGPALKVTRWSVDHQHTNGSWDYGELTSQRWVDNFHTGYNLCALKSIRDSTGSFEFEKSLCLGFQFYVRNFFTRENAPRYFANQNYPIDIHSVAQSIITLHTLQELNGSNVRLAELVYHWAMTHMWDEEGYFYYQVLPYLTNKISYMRWSQAWMLLALATLLECDDRVPSDPVGIA